MEIGSPGWITPRWKPNSPKRSKLSSPSKVRSEPPKLPRCSQRARRALSTYQPFPRGTSPSGVDSISAIGARNRTGIEQLPDLRAAQAEHLGEDRLGVLAQPRRG